MELTVRNVNEAFEYIVDLFNGDSMFSSQVHTHDSRNGLVMQYTRPAMIIYTHPRERVLFNTARDCNPFFHLFESFWMLAGRNDVSPLKYYVSTIDQFSDNGETFHGAYGDRWRNWFGFDQIDNIAENLREDPTSRREVLQIWDSTVEGPSTQAEFNDPYMAYNGGKDVPCNTQAYFSIRNDNTTEGPVLDMTVCNRSNDAIWGMLGANAVHFSILQEYLAARIGVEVGRYTQFTNNLHVYESNWYPEKWQEYYENHVVDPYTHRSIPHASALTYPSLVKDPSVFLLEVERMVDSIDGEFTEPFLRNTAQPMFAAFRKHKQRQYLGDQGALELINRVHAQDWRIAGRNWLDKRHDNWMKK